MKLSQVKNPSDLLSGLLIFSLGLIVAIYSIGYDIGTVANMGPGAYPLLLGALLCLLGVSISVTALRQKGPPISIDKLGAICVIASIISFALALETLGLIFATALSVMIALLPSNLPYKTRAWLIFSICLIVYLVFFVGLRINVMLWPWSWS